MEEKMTRPGPACVHVPVQTHARLIRPRIILLLQTRADSYHEMGIGVLPIFYLGEGNQKSLLGKWGGGILSRGEGGHWIEPRKQDPRVLPWVKRFF